MFVLVKVWSNSTLRFVVVNFFLCFSLMFKGKCSLVYPFGQVLTLKFVAVKIFWSKSNQNLVILIQSCELASFLSYPKLFQFMSTTFHFIYLFPYVFSVSHLFYSLINLLCLFSFMSIVFLSSLYLFLPLCFSVFLFPFYIWCT